METTTTPEKKQKPKAKVASTTPVRVRTETKKRILQEVAKANKKDFGKRVRVEDVISLAMSLLEPSHIKSLQEASLTNADRLEKNYREYIAKNDPVTKDTFLGLLMSGEVKTSGEPDVKTSTHGA